MTKDELLARLHSIEWSDIEFKEAAGPFPKMPCLPSARLPI